MLQMNTLNAPPYGIQAETPGYSPPPSILFSVQVDDKTVTYYS